MNLSWTDSVCIGAVSIKPFWTYLYKILPCLQKSMISSPIPHFLVKDHFFSSAPWCEGVLPTSHVADNMQRGQDGSAHSQSAHSSSVKLAEVVPPSEALCIGGGKGKNQGRAQRKDSCPSPQKIPEKPTLGVHAGRKTTWVLCVPCSWGVASWCSTPPGSAQVGKPDRTSSGKSLTNQPHKAKQAHARGSTAWGISSPGLES